MTTTETAHEETSLRTPAQRPDTPAEVTRWPAADACHAVPVDISDTQLDFGFPELKPLPRARFGGEMPDLLAIRREYLAGAPASELIRPVVRESWERCRRHGLRPGSMRVQSPDPAGLAAARDANRDLLRVAEPLLRIVHDSLGEAPHSVALCDRRGVALVVLRDPVLAADPNAVALNLFEGANWSEADIGTNGAGTALAAGRPVVLIGPEHLVEAFSDWTCLGVPLRNEAGEIIGALDMSVPNQGIRTEMWGWVLSIAQQIEARLRDGSATPGIELDGSWDQAVSALSGITELLLSQLNLPPTHAQFVEEVRQAISVAAIENLRTNRELKRTKELLEAVVKAAPAGILVCNRAGEFLFSNPALHEILGGLPVGSAGQLGERYTLHNLDGTAFDAELPLVRALRGEACARQELMVRRHDGSEVSAFVGAAPLRDGNGTIWGAVATMSDVTEQVRARQAIARSEEALRERQRVKTFLLEFTDRLRSMPDPNRIPYAAARALGEHLMADRVVFAEAKTGANVLAIAAQYVAGIEPSAALNDDLVHGAVDALEQSRRVAMPGHAGAPARCDVTEAAPATGRAGELLQVPVMKGGQLAAILGVQYRAVHAWTPDEIGLVEQAAERTWAALQQARAEEALRAAQAQLQEHATKLESTVAQRTAKLTETVGELEHFSYTIAHDMRAPLRAMRGFGEILLESHNDRLDQDGRGYLRRIAAAAARMDDLITDALNYSKAMRMELMLEPIDPGRLIRDIVELYPQFQQSGASFDVAEAFPPVLANKAGLTQCVSNLLDNAVKFVAPGKTPAIRIWAEPRGDLVRLWFEDNGIGIAKEQQERVFGMFAQLNSGYEGTGIGLALVRKVAQRMQGSVGVESEPAKGSRFWLDLRRVAE